MKQFLILITTNVKLSFRNKNESFISVLFFLFSLLILPLVFQGDKEIIKKFLIGIIWFLTLLTVIFSIEKLFESDFEDGTLDQIFISGIPPELIFFSKAISIWIITCLPITIIAPTFIFLFDLTLIKTFALFISLLFGTPILCLIGSITSVLILGLKKGGAIISLLTLPLYVPVLIFGINSSNSEFSLNFVSYELKMLLGYFFIVLAIAPWIGGMALKINYK